jgi:hypothetical protein
MKLFANGCSFTWGGAIYPSLHDAQGKLLDYYNPSPLNQQRLNDVWPNKLAALINANECVNLGMGCGSNERIVRTTIDFFTEKLVRKEFSNDWVAVIQLTQPPRYEYWDEETETWAMVIPNGVNVGKPVDWEVTKRLDRFKDITYSYENDYTHSQRYWTQVVSLASFFEQYKIKYWFGNLGLDVWPLLGAWQQEYLKTRVRWLKNDPYYMFGSLFRDRHEGGSGHPSLLGQDQIANSIYTIIKNEL